MFSIMADLGQIAAKQQFSIDFTEDDDEFAFVYWLNNLITEARINHMMFCEFHLTKKGNRWRGYVKGDNWLSEKTHGVEVKGATLTMLSVKKTNNQWEAQCVVDL